jgi:hypothetical protein
MSSNFNPRASMSRRGEHPDIDPETGADRPDPWDQFASDPVFAGQFMDQVTREQRALPEHIQWEVGGQAFGVGRGHGEGVREYNDFVKARLHENLLMLRGEWNAQSPERQDELMAEGWRVHDPFNREGRVPLHTVEQWSDPSTIMEYNQAVARRNRGE